SLGTAVNESALQRQLEMMKEMGANAIRVTHHPATTQLLNLCNRMGLLVIEEAFDTWTMTKAGNTYDYGYWFSTPIGNDNEILNRENCTNWVDYDLRQMVRHSVNAPSVIMYSLGNELFEGITNTRGKQNYLNHARYLIQTIQSMTKDKILTIGDNSHNKTVQTDKELGIAINELIYQAGGVIGYNYTRKGKYTDLYEQFPWAMYGSEVASAVSTRDYYLTTGTDDENHQLIGDGSKAVSWGATPWDAWFEVISRDYVAGAFVWTGFDYGGEPSPWNSTGKSKDGSVNPKSSYFGIVDLAGIKKDSFYFYQSQWNRDVNTLHIAPYWTGDCLAKDENGNVKVVLYSPMPRLWNCS
ncbi:MAG: beta-galactosidase, partial [Erysipelotrichaceae bacterium]|nr:beta-galactosidase [Erysipelotrichaceae bacterium]